MTDINLDELERLAKNAIEMLKRNDWPCDGLDGNDAKRFIAAADPLTILALIARIRKLEAVTEATQRLLALLAPDGFMKGGGGDAGYGQEVIAAWRGGVERVTKALAALDAKEET